MGKDSTVVWAYAKKEPVWGELTRPQSKVYIAVGLSQACRDFLELAETHSRKWQRALNYEQEQRVHLEETIEQLAKQHNSLERAFCNTPGGPASSSKSFSEGV
jgi:hypothetical protein